MNDVQLESIEIPLTRRPDGRDRSQYVRYKSATALRLAWAFLRRNRDFQRHCIAVELGLVAATTVAARFGLLTFRDFRWSYRHGGSTPQFTFTRGSAIYVPGQAAEDANESNFIHLRVRPSDFDVGELGMKIKMRAIRRELKAAIAVAAPNCSKQLQIKTDSFFELIQLLDLIDAGASDEELIEKVNALKLRTTDGQTPALHMRRMKKRAAEMCAQGYKELAVVGHARAKRERSLTSKKTTESIAGPASDA